MFLSTMFGYNQSTVLFSHAKPALTTSQPAVLLSYNKSAPATSHNKLAVLFNAGWKLLVLNLLDGWRVKRIFHTPN